MVRIIASWGRGGTRKRGGRPLRNNHPSTGLSNVREWAKEVTMRPAKGKGVLAPTKIGTKGPVKGSTSSQGGPAFSHLPRSYEGSKGHSATSSATQGTKGGSHFPFMPNKPEGS